MHVEELNDKGEWENFLQTCPDGTFYHSMKWREVLERSFHDLPVYLAVSDAHGVVGICPGFIQRAMHTKIFSSMPYSDYGGPLIAPHCAKDAALSLQHFLQRYCASMSVAYLKIRFMDEDREGFHSWPGGYPSKGVGTVEINLDATPTQLMWNNVFSHDRRSKIRRFERDGFHAQQARTKSDLRDFYHLYCENMKFIGVRPYPYNFLENMWTLLHPLNLRIWLVAREEAIGGILVLKDTRRTYWFLAGNARRRTYSRYPVMNYLLWKEIETAEAEGYRRVSLGSTPGDPNDSHYLQKTSFGGAFNEQRLVCYPCNSTGRVYLQARAKALAAWRAVRGFVPIRLKRMLEGKVARFL